MIRTELSAEESRFDASELIAQLAEQRELYGELTGLAEHQRSLIAGDDTESLLEVLGQRQKLVDRLTELADRLRPYQQDWAVIRSRMSEADGREVDRLVSEVNELLATILERDRSDTEQLASRKSSTAADLADVKRSRAAGAAYAAEADAGRSRAEWTGK